MLGSMLPDELLLRKVMQTNTAPGRVGGTAISRLKPDYCSARADYRACHTVSDMLQGVWLPPAQASSTHVLQVPLTRRFPALHPAYPRRSPQCTCEHTSSVKDSSIIVSFEAAKCCASGSLLSAAQCAESTPAASPLHAPRRTAAYGGPAGFYWRRA
jgi:hypothetical protein